MLDWNTVIIAVIGSSGISAIVVKLLDIFSKKKDERDEYQKARDTIYMSLAANTLMYILHECIEKKQITTYQYKFCETLYSAYKKLDGNGLIDDLWLNKAQQLNVI